MSTTADFERASSPSAPSRGWWARAWIWAAPLALAVAGAAVYAEVLNAPLVFDDIINIVENDTVQRPAVHKLYHNGGRRIVAFVTFALNQEAHGLWLAGYRATNIAIHILAAIVLFDLVRITLTRTQFGQRCAAAIVPAAFCAALLWIVHPLATQAVTYVVQRMESLASLFYLATLWGLARGATSKHAGLWLMLAVLSAWLGTATKETAATLPLAALLLDRAFFAASWRELWRRRWAFYVALVPATLLLAASVLPFFQSDAKSGSDTAGVGIVSRRHLGSISVRSRGSYCTMCDWRSGRAGSVSITPGPSRATSASGCRRWWAWGLCSQRRWCSWFVALSLAFCPRCSSWCLRLVRASCPFATWRSNTGCICRWRRSSSAW